MEIWFLILFQALGGVLIVAFGVGIFLVILTLIVKVIIKALGNLDPLVERLFRNDGDKGRCGCIEASQKADEQTVVGACEKAADKSSPPNDAPIDMGKH